MENPYNTLIIIDFVTRGILIIFFIAAFIVMSKMFIQQSKLLKNQKEGLDYFRNLVNSTIKLYEQRDEQIKKISKTKENELKKLFESELTKREKSVGMLFDENFELVLTISRLSYVFAMHSYFEKTIKEMKNISSKQLILKEINKRKKELEAQNIVPLDGFAQLQKSMQNLEPLFKRLQETFEQKKKPSSSQK